MSRLADDLMRDDPRSGFAEELTQSNISQWAEESVAICLATVYRNLDPNITRFEDKHVGYEADATRTARRRAAMEDSRWRRS